ncbi:MAG: type II secretion system F family protein [Thermoplasmata archaeon]|nr:type II secretion system F family protein [Thermoplasmata archaeon]MCI4359746.1 type II secretion system F family protein [Thermoplasmata archaeon]
MAGANATAGQVAQKVSGAGVFQIHEEKEHLRKELLILLLGVVLAMALWVVAVLNLTGTLSTPLAPGEVTGENPAIDFFVLGAILVLGPFGFAETARIRRIDKIEERLPDFLRDVAEAGRFGMTLPDAIIVASKGRYGLLTDEIKRMASQLEWGVPVATALRLFEERVPTPLVQRVVSIITRSNDAGGNVADVLTMVAHDTREVQNQLAARKISMLTYVTVIYISFFVFLVTIYIMAAVFLPQMVLAGQGIASSSLSSGGAVTLSFTLVPALFVAFLVAVIVHAIGDGIMAGVLFSGKFPEGFQHATIMLIAGWVIMRFVVPPITA